MNIPLGVVSEGLMTMERLAILRQWEWDKLAGSEEIEPRLSLAELTLRGHVQKCIPVEFFEVPNIWCEPLSIPAYILPVVQHPYTNANLALRLPGRS
jgi:hypothetical protein